MRRLAHALISVHFLAAVGCADSEPRKRVAELFPDPGSARFQAIVDHGDHVCGQVNGKADGRTYDGYRRFVYDRRNKLALIDAGAAALGPEGLAPNAACSKPSAYQSVDERLTCAEAPQRHLAASRQAEFEASWLAICTSG